MMNIIEYDPKYAQDIIDLIGDIRINELHWPMDTPDQDDIKHIDRYYIGGNNNFWLALDGEQVIGTIGLEDRGSHQGFLKRMYLDEKYRGSGVADQLLDTLIEFAKEKGYREIYLSSTDEAKRAITYYKKSGFSQVDGLPPNFPQHPDATVYFRIVL